MLSLKEPQVQRLDLPHPTLSSVHLPHSPIDLYCQEFLSQSVKWEYLWILSGDCPILRMMKGLRRNQLERIPIGFGRTASGKHQSCVSAQNPWPFAPSVFLYCSQFPSLASTLPPPSSQRAGSNCRAIPAAISGNWSERCRQRGPLHSSLFTRSMYPIKGF